MKHTGQQNTRGHSQKLAKSEDQNAPKLLFTKHISNN